MNEFSLVCRLLGTLFNRAPADPVLAPVLTMIKQGQLKAHWPLEQRSEEHTSELQSQR